MNKVTTIVSGLLTAGVLASGAAQAAGSINYLQIDGDVVVFGTNDSTAPSRPACATTDKWTVNLNSDSGKANYALLMSAMSGKMDVAVSGQGDCADKSDTERAGIVTITEAASEAEALATNYTSCNDILKQNPAAQDGVYLIDPDLIEPNIPFEVYCDMTRDGGGWTLVARAKHGDTENWSMSKAWNLEDSTNPQANQTFVIPTWFYSKMSRAHARVIRDSFADHLFFSGGGLTNRTGCWEVDARCRNGGVNAGMGGLQRVEAAHQLYISTHSTKGGWYVGDGTLYGYSDGNGGPGEASTNFDSGTGTFDTSFTIWVR